MTQSTKRIIALCLVLLLFVGLEIPSLMSRGIDENESITIASIAGHASLTETDIGYAEPLPADKLRTRLLGTPATFGVIAQGLKEHDRYPPLYFWVSAAIGKVTGLDLMTVRGLSLACGVLFLAAIGMLFRKRMPFATWCLFLIAVAFSSSTAFYSAQARPYITCMAIAAVLAALTDQLNSLSLKTKRFALIAAIGFVGGLGFITNYFMLYPAFAVGVWLLLQFNRSWFERIKEGAVYGFCFFILAIYGVTFAKVQVTYQPDLASGYNGPIQDLARALDCVLKLLVYQPPFHLNIFVALLFVAAIAFAIFKRRSEVTFANFSLLFAAIAIGGWLVMNAGTHKHLYQIRYMTFFLPGIWMLAGFGLSQTPAKFVRYINVAVVALILVELSVLNLTPVPTHAVFTSSAYRDIATEVIAKINSSPKPAQCILLERGHDRGWLAGLTYELGRITSLPVQFVGADDDAQKVNRCSTETVWYLIDEDIHDVKRKAFLESLTAQKDAQKTDKPDGSKFKLVHAEKWGLELQQIL